MTLSSSSSRPQRKSMLPTPRLSSRISSKRAAMSDPTSRIARHGPSPLRALHTAAQPDIIPPPPTRPPQPELGSRRSGTLLNTTSSRIPSPPLGHWQNFNSTPESASGELSSCLIGGAGPWATQAPLDSEQGRRVEAAAHHRDPTSSFIASSTTRQEQHFEGQEENVVAPAQHQGAADMDIGTSSAPPHSFRAARRRTTTALVTFSSRIENIISSSSSAAEYGLPALPRKKSILANSLSASGGKENRRPQVVQARVRVPTPPVTTFAAPIGVPLRPVQQRVAAATTTSTGVTRPLSRTSSPSREGLKPPFPPLAIRKESASSVRRRPSQLGSVPGVAAATAVVLVPTGIKALIEDVDRFAKGWTGMFNDLFAVSDREDLPSNSDASTGMKPALAQVVSQDENGIPETGREFNKDPRETSSEWVVPVNALQTSNLVRGEGEMVDFDVTAASLSRWQRRDNTMLKNPPVEGTIETGLYEVTSTSAPDSPNTDKAYRHPEKVLRRRQPVDITPQTSRYLPLLPEINQSPIIPGTHLVEMASVKSNNPKDELTRLLELSSSPTTLNRTDPTQHHDIITRPHPAAMIPSVSSSPISTTSSRGSVSTPHTSSPSVTNPRVYEFASPRSIHASSDDVVPTRSSSLRGIRAIFKRTSAGLAGGERKRAESLKERIGEPRVLSLGSVSISNLPDAGSAILAGPVDGGVKPGSEDDSRVMGAGLRH